MTEEKKLMRINLCNNLHDGYERTLPFDQLSFAIVGSSEDKNKEGLKRRKQVTNFSTCREDLCSSLRTAVQVLDKDDKNAPDFNALRLLMGIGTNSRNKETTREQRDKLFSGKRALNLLEEAAGWNLSVITTVKHEDYNTGDVFLLTGDKRWIIAPQMVSLVGLIMRLGWRENLNTTSLDTLMKHFSSLAKGIKEHNDRIFIGTCRNHILPLMKNVEKVFSEELKTYFPGEDAKGFVGYGGIDTFVKCGTGNQKLETAFMKHVLNKKIKED